MATRYDGHMSSSRRSVAEAALKLLNSGRLGEAREAASLAARGVTRCHPVHGLLAMILLQLGERDAAAEEIKRASSLAPGSADAYDALAFVSRQLGLHELSRGLYQRATIAAPGEARYWYNLATSERSFGRLAEAEAACQRAIDVNADSFSSYLLRSELCVQSEQSNHIDELLLRLGSRKLDDRGTMFLAYAVAKELDDVGRYDEAFRWFQTGASARRRHLAYDVAIDERKMARIQAAFPPCAVQSPATGHDDSRGCIFVMGLPRTGTTLVERILSGHAGVRSNGETDNFATALMGRLALPVEAGSGGAAEDVFASAAAADSAAVAARYFDLAGRPGAGECVVEKLPMNYLYLGAIHRALPGARLVLLKRDPLDTCFAMYRTLFAAAYPFSYEFGELARYFSAYQRLVDHWRACLGEALLEVHYERLVAQPTEVGEVLARHCGIPWDTRALAVERNAGVSLTASAAQIRRPIYGSSSGRWRLYRAHLKPLIDALRQQGAQVADVD